MTYANGNIELAPDERNYWLRMFGDMRLVELACIMAAVAVSRSPTALTPYDARVRAFLARQAYATIERQTRGAYQIGPMRGVRGIRDTSEPFADYAARMQREGHLNGKRAAGY